MTAEMDIDESTVVKFVCKRKLSAFVPTEIEPVGKWFHKYEHDLWARASECESDVSEESETTEHDFEIEDNLKYLKTLDCKDWKDQDHYKVLGISKYRYIANQEDIKKAYRAMVRRHHPDKNTTEEDNAHTEGYYGCFKRAFDILGSIENRRAYDSVDPSFNDEVPGTGTHNQNNFFEVFGPVFEQNARWSVHKHVPLLGKKDDDKSKVENFYNFWYEFSSWREFSYLDEENLEEAVDREERRYKDKINKANRALLKKEEMQRIRRLVENAYSIDPRIARFKEEDRKERQAKKKAKDDAIRQRQEERERRRREAEELERIKKEEEAAILKAKQAKEKKEREAIKKVLKNERKTLRNLCKENNYFINHIDETVDMMTNVEFLCEGLDIESFQIFNRKLLDANHDREEARKVFLDQVTVIKENIEQHRGNGYTQSKEVVKPTQEKTKPWSPDDLQLLIKAVNLFPAGTVKRWDVVAEYLNQHSTNCTTRSAKEVLNKTKELQKSDQHIKDAAKKTALKSMEKNQPMVADSTASQRLETPQEMLGFNLAPWSPDEQRLLEQALKTYPSSAADRWDKIAECLPNRSKKDCMKRYKELVERVKAKKAAQMAVGTTK